MHGALAEIALTAKIVQKVRNSGRSETESPCSCAILETHHQSVFGLREGRVSGWVRFSYPQSREIPTWRVAPGATVTLGHRSFTNERGKGRTERNEAKRGEREQPVEGRKMTQRTRTNRAKTDQNISHDWYPGFAGIFELFSVFFSA